MRYHLRSVNPPVLYKQVRLYPVPQLVPPQVEETKEIEGDPPLQQMLYVL